MCLVRLSTHLNDRCASLSSWGWRSDLIWTVEWWWRPPKWVFDRLITVLYFRRLFRYLGKMTTPFCSASIQLMVSYVSDQKDADYVYDIARWRHLRKIIRRPGLVPPVFLQWQLDHVLVIDTMELIWQKKSGRRNLHSPETNPFIHLFSPRKSSSKGIGKKHISLLTTANLRNRKEKWCTKTWGREGLQSFLPETFQIWVVVPSKKHPIAKVQRLAFPCRRFVSMYCTHSQVTY